jgi:TolB-like protein/tetratricopeptide (TPR) repeat protein
MALALTALVVVAASLWLRRPASEKSPPAELRRDASATTAAVAAKPPLDFAAAKSIAVLAFENVGGDKENEIFSDGVPEEILTQLGKVAGLRLAGRNSSFALRGRPEAEVAQKLNVIYVVSGSVQRVGSQVKITARLVNAADGMQLWQDRFTEDMKDIFAVQEKIAGLIAQNLSLKLGGAPRAAKAIDPEAQRLVLEGRYHLNLRTDEGFTRAEAAFAKAIALAPDFAEAHAGLAAVYVVRANFSEMDGNKDSANDLAHGRAAIERAVKLDASLAEAHAVLGLELMIERKLKESEQSSRHALALNPNSASAHFWRGNTLTCLGRIDLSIEEFRRSTALDPLWFINLVSMSFRLSDGALWSEALEVADRALALRPGIYIPALGARARALARLGRIAEAVETVRTMRQHLNSFPRWNVDAVGISILRQAGLGSEAADYAAQVLARKDLPVDSYLRGFVLGALGRFEEARPFLERTPAITTSSLLYDQMWDSWRESAGFRELIAKLGIVEEYKTARETLARMQRERAGKK